MLNLRPNKEIDFVGKITVFGPISAVLVVASLLLTVTRGINFGIDFAGGYEIQVAFDKAVTETDIKGLVGPLGLGDARVQRFGPENANEYLILVRKTGTISEEKKRQLQGEFETLAGGVDNLLTWSVAQSGERLVVAFAEAREEAQVRAIIEKYGLTIKDVSAGQRTDQSGFTVELVSLADDIEAALREGLAIPDKITIVQRVEFVGPQVGAQLQTQGLFAVLWALFFILLYIAVRFDLLFSPGAILALVHDVLITIGCFSLLQLEFNLPIVAAILAIIGYSLNDTIVVYDRIRENAARLRGRELRAMVNTSLNQTLSRTLLTSFTTLLVVTALLAVGGGIIRDFSIALVIGVLVGTYSSVFVASPAYILLRERYRGEARSDGQVAAA